MNRQQLWESIKLKKWTIWKYFRMVYWSAIFVLALYFILLIVLTLFI